MRLSELLLLMTNLVSSLVPFLPWWSVVIAACETGVFTKTRVRDGSVLVDQSWFQRVNKLFSRLKCGNLAVIIWILDHPAAAKLIKTATDALGVTDLTM